MNENKKTEIKWWHLLAAGGGLNLLLGHSLIGDILAGVGLGWGILLLIKYVYGKVAQKKAKKMGSEKDLIEVEQPETLHCGKCGNKLGNNSKFCSKCGAKI